MRGDASVFEEDFSHLEERLAAAFMKSSLPADAPNVAALEDFLVHERRARF